MLAVILAVVLTLTLATPAFAGPPEDKPGPGNMPDGAEDALTVIVTPALPGTLLHHMFISFYCTVLQGNNSQGWHAYMNGLTAVNAIYQIEDLLGSP